MRLIKLLSLFIVISSLMIGCRMSVNRSIHIRDGETVRHGLSSVNGSVIVGSDCVVVGKCRSVNGRVEVGNDSEVGDLQSVNGRISVGRNVEIDGDIESVNGSIRCDQEVNVRGKVATINGSIDLDKTDVRRNISTYNGHITLTNQSMVQRNIIIRDSKSRSDSRRPLKIRIEDNSVVEGDIMVRDEDKEVKVYLLNGGKVNGRIEGAKVIRE